MKRTLVAFTGVLLGVVVAGAGCYSDDYAARPAYARAVTVAPPPAPVDEVPPAEPYAGAVWMSGYWDWRPEVRRHVWVAGHWGTPPRSGVAYMPPSWHRNANGGYYQTPGRWVAGPARDAYGRHIAYDTNGRPHYF
jgi:hypothetical protein